LTRSVDADEASLSEAFLRGLRSAIVACDLAEVVGTAMALKLLFGISLIGGALIAALDVFLLRMYEGFASLNRSSLHCWS